jgi:hypothetical protein
MITAFTDKQLHIAAQLGYFSFTENMYFTLGELFEEPDIQKTSLKLAVYELMTMKNQELVDYDFYNQYMNDARKMLAFELEKMGCKDKYSQTWADSILNG